jgi:hypothetical protein
VDQYYAVRDNQSARSVQSGSYPVFTAAAAAAPASEERPQDGGADYSVVSLDELPDEEDGYVLENAPYVQYEAEGSEFGNVLDSQIPDLHAYEAPYPGSAAFDADVAQRGAVKASSPFEEDGAPPAAQAQTASTQAYPVIGGGVSQSDGADLAQSGGFQFKGSYSASAGCGCGRSREAVASSAAQEASSASSISDLLSLVLILLLLSEAGNRGGKQAGAQGGAPLGKAKEKSKGCDC